MCKPHSLRRSANPKHTLLQLGLVGYGQYQTTDSSRSLAFADDVRYKVNALGVTAGVV
jgi:hypothetical protein